MKALVFIANNTVAHLAKRDQVIGVIFPGFKSFEIFDVMDMHDFINTTAGLACVAVSGENLAPYSIPSWVF